MAQYLQITFQNLSEQVSELLIAKLIEIGFDGFEEEGGNVNAFIPANKFDEASLKGIAESFEIDYSQSIIEETNWNHLWESNFEPVVIDDFVAIRADFHEPIKNVRHEIIITPKMSFGTGHHATTKMMIQQMEKIDFAHKSVFDFGTGTGILSILAEKLGASKIIAVDNDDWSIENAEENFQRNHCRRIELKQADSIMNDHLFNIILANINKNVIMDHFSTLINQLARRGVLVVSGILEDDKEDILNTAAEFSLQYENTMTNNNWMCIRFSR